MSPQSWTDCPRCKQIAATKNAREIEDAKGQYGKIPLDEFEQLMAEAGQHPFVSGTMREDYDIGVDEYGEFMVSYSCLCEICDFKYEFPLQRIQVYTGEVTND